jgi:hypothetical protein
MELQTALLAFGLPLAYQQFPEGSNPRPPYLVFLDKAPGSDVSTEDRSLDLKADNRTWLRRRRIRLELYTEQGDALASISLGESFEDYLDDQGIPYAYEGKAEIESEQLYMTVWTVTIMY